MRIITFNLFGIKDEPTFEFNGVIDYNKSKWGNDYIVADENTVIDGVKIGDIIKNSNFCNSGINDKRFIKDYVEFYLAANITEPTIFCDLDVEIIKITDYLTDNDFLIDYLLGDLIVDCFFLKNKSEKFENIYKKMDSEPSYYRGDYQTLSNIFNGTKDINFYMMMINNYFHCNCKDGFKDVVLKFKCEFEEKDLDGVYLLNSKRYLTKSRKIKSSLGNKVYHTKDDYYKLSKNLPL